MTEQLKCLFKKDMCEMKNKYKSKRQTYGLFGYFLYFVFISLLIVCAVMMYAELSKAYIYNAGVAIYKRQTELLTITFLVIFIVNIFSGIKNIYKKIVDNADMDKLSILPIDSKTLFVYKTSYIFFNQIISSVLTILPLGLVFGIVCAKGIIFYICLIFAMFAVPIISIGIASILVIPFYFFKKFMQSRYISLIIIYSALLALGFFLYGKVLSALNNLLVSGNLNNFFDERKYKIIEKIAKFSFPANFFGDFLLGNNRLLSFIAIIGLCVISVLILIFALTKVFNVLAKKNANSKSNAIKIKSSLKRKNWFVSLLNKEFISIIRTPNFAFSLFSMALDLPILTLLCTRLLSNLVNNLVYLNLEYQISFFVLCMFALLTNTFCASNISREGKNFYIAKLLPLTNFQIMVPKIFLCFMVSSISVFASAIVLVSCGYLTILQALGITFVVECLCLAENLFATKYDLKHPTFAKNAKGEADTTTKSSNVCSILAFFISILLVGLVIVHSIFSLLKGDQVSNFVIYVFPLITSVILLGICIIYFAKGLNKTKEEN